MDEFGKACSFTGHRAAKLPWKYDERDIRCVQLKENLYAVTEAVCESGITHFICGMALGCDMYFAEAVLRLKRTHPEVTLEAAVPYDGQDENWSDRHRRRYRDILMGCDKISILAERYYPGCMQRRNRYMIDRSSVLIACYSGQTGGTWSTIEYAMKKDLEVIQIPIDSDAP